MADIADDVLRELYAGPPEGFVAGRDAAVAAARAAGDRPLATAIGGLRKPTVGAWLVNLLAWHAPDDLAALYAVGDELRAAQRDLRGGDLRQLSARRKTTIADLVTGRGRSPRRPVRGRGAALGRGDGHAQRRTLDVDTAEQVRAGRLVRTTAYAGFGEPGGGWATAPADEGSEAPVRARRPATSGGTSGRGTGGRPADRAQARQAGPADRTPAGREDTAAGPESQAAQRAAEAAAMEERAAEAAARAELRAAQRDEERVRAAYDAAAGAEERARERLAEVEQALAELRERKVALQEEANGRRAERQAAQRDLTAATRRLQRARDRQPE
ncbi:hypothetical protein ACFQX7_38740 [Luedemannella flava]